MTRRESRDEYDRLCRLIQRWNDKRVELFEISLPNERHEFGGVMKFYFQYEGIDGQKVATKCIRVSNTATVDNVIEILVQKFRPDLKMLTNLHSYALYEIHNDKTGAEVRKMDGNDKPLLAMLKWSKGDREGRFLLRNEFRSILFPHSKENRTSAAKKEKRSPKQKKRAKSKRYTSKDDILKEGRDDCIFESKDIDGTTERETIAESLYQVYPPSRFTRSITNPDIVRKLWNSTSDKKLRGSFQAIDEELTANDSVPILTDSLLPEMPVKTILATKDDTALQIVRNTVEKFGLVDPDDFCLVEVTLPSVEVSNPHVSGRVELHERVLQDDECPVLLHTRWSLGDSGYLNHNPIQFQLRRRNSFRNGLKIPNTDMLSSKHITPALVQLSHSTNETPSHGHKRHTIPSFPIEIGSYVSLLDSKSFIFLTSPGICPRHCIISTTPMNTYTISPLDRKAVVFVNNQRILQTAHLPVNSLIHLGDREVFSFVVSNSPVHFRSSSALTGEHEIGNTSKLLGKAYSTDNLAPTSSNDAVLNHKGHNRTVSEHTLKGEGEAVRVVTMEEIEKEDQFDLTGEDIDSVTNITTTRGTKKRHNSAPHSGDPQFLEETPESELAVLPASITFSQQSESTLLQRLISEVNGCVLEFKLAPAYALYMIARHHLSSEFHPEPTRHQSLIQMLKSTCSYTKRTVKDSKSIPGALAFWLSNTSELLHFLRRDYRLSMFAHEYENTLTSIIHMAYKHFTEFMVCEIGVFLSAFLSESPEADREDIILERLDDKDITSQEPDVVPHGVLTRQASLVSYYWSAAGTRITRKGRPTLGNILSTLTAAVSLLHQCRVNTTLSILIFNLLFRYISMRLFNKLVTESKYCTRATGQRLVRRLDRLKAWALKENLKMSAEDHLTTIVQAGKLLQASKKNPDDVQLIHSMCHKLNSRQVATLLSNYESTEGEGSVNQTIEEQLISLAHTNADQDLISNGFEVHLQEDPNLELPFLIPEHGYSCDMMRGVPVGLEEYLEPAVHTGLCNLVVTKDRLGCWVPARTTTSNQRESPLSTQASTQMSQTLPKNFPQNPFAGIDENEILRPHSAINISDSGLSSARIFAVTLRKGFDKSLGINICEGKVRFGHEELCIFIKSLSVGGPAGQDGRLRPGDRILKVDNTILSGYTKEMVIKLLRNSNEEVTLTVASEAAQLYRLSHLLENSPGNQRKHDDIIEHVPLKQGSSHAMKAARRQLRQQQLISGDFHSPRQSFNPSVYAHDPHFISPPPPSIHNHTDSHMAKWLLEQQDRVHPKSTDYSRVTIPKPSQSLSSLIPEREEKSSPTERRRDSIERGNLDHYITSTPTGSDTSDSIIHTPIRHHYVNFNILGSPSRLHDPLSSKLQDSGYPSKLQDSGYPSKLQDSGYPSKLQDSGYPSKLQDSSYPSKLQDSGYPSKLQDSGYPSKLQDSGYPSITDHLHSDSSYSNSGQMPYKDVSTSLSCQPSSSDINGSQAYPSLMMEKLSMEVGCHTQSNLSSTGMSVTSVLEHLSRKGKSHGLNQSELKNLDVDELQLEKQRMHLLFYEQRKEAETKGVLALEKQPPLDATTKVNEWVSNKGEKDVRLMEEGDESEMIDHEKFMQITKLQQKLDSLRKVISDQRKRNRETQFAKERVKQNLLEDERKFKSQNARNFKPFMKQEDESRWQRDQRRRLKDWDKVKAERTEELHQFEVKEHEGRTRLKALEQHAGELKKQLQACESSSKPRGNSSSRMMQDIPERDWTDSSRPPRVMSTESITTASSLVSSENPDVARDLISLGSDSNLPGITDCSILGARSSPSGNRSDSSSPIPSYPRSYYPPEMHGNIEIPTFLRNQELAKNGKLPLSRESSADQDKRLRILKEERNLYIGSLNNITNKSIEDKTLQFRQLHMEVVNSKESLDQPELDAGLSRMYQPTNRGMTSPTHLTHYKGLGDDSVESSMSTTPDVIPAFLAPQFLPHSNQSSSSGNIPHMSDFNRSYPRSKTHDLRPSSGTYFTDTNLTSRPIHSDMMSHDYSSSHDISRMGRPRSREGLFDKSESIPYLGHTIHQNPLESIHYQTESNKRIGPKKVTKIGGSTSSHKYSHGRPDPPNVDERFKQYRGHVSSSSNLLSAGHHVQRQQTEL